MVGYQCEARTASALDKRGDENLFLLYYYFSQLVKVEFL